MAACAYTVFFIYGSLAPLDWQPQTLNHALSSFMGLPGPHWPAEERVDAAVNFLLPLPLAFALAVGVALTAALQWAGWRRLGAEPPPPSASGRNRRGALPAA